jgi:hypothetical protein
VGRRSKKIRADAISIDSGHVVMLSDPDEVAEAIVRAAH